MLYFDTVVRCLFDKVYHLQQAEFVLKRGWQGYVCTEKHVSRPVTGKHGQRVVSGTCKGTSEILCFNYTLLEANTRPSNESHVAQRVLKTAE